MKENYEQGHNDHQVTKIWGEIYKNKLFPLEFFLCSDICKKHILCANKIPMFSIQCYAILVGAIWKIFYY